uniref:Nucleotide-binding alpha-beta plait domain-containing protein n=1 Tax=Tanacetum cinerariifolium TaxID=118510 RepID=A0A699H1G3_TANCI|nr:nucleotide-binding alpha-beta plait domain-containing protein [Tanacetum cinerariifolium]
MVVVMKEKWWRVMWNKKIKKINDVDNNPVAIFLALDVSPDEMRRMSDVEGRANQVTYSIFVTNFPSGTSAKQLWDICEHYGKVVDSFIPARVSKEGKNFAFVCFSKVNNIEVLIGNLNTGWIGKFKLQFNVARFQRGAKNNGVKNVEPKQPVRFNVHASCSFSHSFAAAVSNEARHNNIKKYMKDKPVMVIDDDFLSDKKFDHMLVDKAKSFDSMPNLGFVFKDEGFKNVNIRYLGGFWVSFEFLDNQAGDCFKKHEGLDTWFSIVQPWKNDFRVDKLCCGLMLKEFYDNILWRKRLCMATKVEDFIMESFKIIIMGKVIVFRAREIIGWIPNYMEEENDTNSDSGYEESEKSVPHTNICLGVKDYFVLVEEVWKPTCSMLLMIGVYAPQELSKKRMLWNYFHGVVHRWQGETIVMGDFNAVRVRSERHDLVFNKQGALMFNSFINSLSLIDVPLGGFLFTRAVINATKMSFDEMVKDDWHNEVVDLLALDEFMEKHLVQKAKVKWAIEGDENSKYLHGIINKKRHQMGIRGISVNREWVMGPHKVFSVLLNQSQQEMLEIEVSNVEIKKAVWGCGVEPGMRKVAWFSWDNIVASKDVGGLSMSSFFAMNYALLFKWIWRFKVRPEAMWVSIIKAIHDSLGSLHRGVKKITKGGAEGVKMEAVSNLIDSLELVDDHDIWVKLIPIKVNVFAWHLALNKLPMRFNMSSRGLEIPSMVCPIYNVGVETSDHLFFSCSVASSIMAKVLGWWGILDSGISSYQGWVSWFEGLRLTKDIKNYLEATFFVSWWFI